MQDNLYNLAMERKLLNTIIQKNNITTEMYELSNHDFYLPAHINIFEHLTRLQTNLKPIDEEFLRMSMQKDNYMDEEVLLEILGTLIIPNQNIKEYVILLRDLGFKRELLKLTTAIKRVTVEEELPSKEIFAIVQNELEILREVITDKTTEEEDICNVEDIVCYPTSLTAFNDITGGGLAFPYLYLLNGVKHSGKTASGIQILKDLSPKLGAHYISLEMAKIEVGRRFKVIGRPVNMSFDFDSYDIEEVIFSIINAHKKGKRVFLIDSIMKINNKKFQSRGRVAELADIASRLAIIKNRLNISIILITQAANSSSSILTTKGSGDVDYEADIMLQISLMGIDNPKREFRSTKNRANGVIQKSYAIFSKEQLLFKNQ